MERRTSSEPVAAAEVVVIRADGTREPPVLVPAAVAGTGPELLARWHPNRFARMRWGLVAAWRRFKRDVMLDDEHPRG